MRGEGPELPTVDVEHVQFAVDTPYEPDVAIKPPGPKRVFAPEVAATVRRAPMAVVAEGTGARLRGAYRAADRRPLAVGGKTGTGDNRFESFGAGRGIATMSPVATSCITMTSTGGASAKSELCSCGRANRRSPTHWRGARRYLN